MKSVESGTESESAPPFPLVEVEVERPLSVTVDEMSTERTAGSVVLSVVIEEKLVEVTEREERIKDEEDVCMRECVVFSVEITD